MPALAGLVASLPPDVADGIRSHADDSLTPHATAEGLRIPGVSLIASGRRP